MVIAEKQGVFIPEKVEKADVLTPFAVETRYPGDWDTVTSKEVEEAISITNAVLKWATEIVTNIK